LHGVEGFFGAAVQIALLTEYFPCWQLPVDTSIVLLHALNPYGFAWLRRWDAENVDLNRNFLLAGENYAGSPTAYGQLDAFFNPTSPPSRWEPFLPQAIALILRYGMAALKDTLPVGHDFPKGLFFGGHAPSSTQVMLAEHLPRWVGTAHKVTHIDLHTGLGRWGTYKLFVEEAADSPSVQRLIEKFGSEAISAFSDRSRIYRTRGSLGKWCKAMFLERTYDLMTAEFGTYDVLSVVKALRAENRAHWWGEPNTSVYRWAKQQIQEAFAPSDRRWREMVLTQAIAVVKQAIT
jgi:hypothetical protein